MSYRIPSSRLVRPITSLTSITIPIRLLPHHARRYATKNENILMERWLQNRGEMPNQKDLQQAAKENLQRGQLHQNSIFIDAERGYAADEGDIVDEEIRPMRNEYKASSPVALSAEDAAIQALTKDGERDVDLLRRRLDMDPETRFKAEYRRTVKMMRRGWTITREQHIKRSERQVRMKSPWLKTSTKKLGLIARQLQGKTVDEALLQLRFSKKRTAGEVARHLEHTRDMAVVKWGMGLGQVEGTAGEPMNIRVNNGTKLGRKKLITDRTEIFVESATVGRGPMQKEPEFRARGKTNILKHRWSCIIFVLKEEISRIRQHEDKMRLAAQKKPRIPLPDKPIPQQRQYVLW
ncbi:ribosomal protein L22 [Microthyrium microscopicum]|uniref:Ribosomal protein L22 n=1 Tax=Microthyrium microscopicum TaxID=703497 RepID=A0A6A6USP4_9PEZI|nr:ribosomal protein L22 [Microthyrium microscopicum]